MHVLVTRSIQDAEPLLARLRERGIEATAEPLLEIEFKTGVRVDLNDVQAVVATSANGVRAFAAASDRRDVGLFAVGDATAETAKEAGFAHVESAGGDVADLAALIAQRLDPAGGAVLHIAATELAGDLGGDLKARGFVYRRTVLYEARPATHLTPETIAAIRDGRIDGVMLYSPRTADIFVSLARKARIVRSCRQLTAFCLSTAVAERARALTWREIAVAGTPDQDSLLALIGIPSLGPWSDMTQPPRPEAESPETDSPEAESDSEKPRDEEAAAVEDTESVAEAEMKAEAEAETPAGEAAEEAPPTDAGTAAGARQFSRRSVVPSVILWTLLMFAVAGGAIYAAYPFWSPYVDAYIQALQKDPFADPRMESMEQRVVALETTGGQNADDALKEMEARRAELSAQVGKLVTRVDSLEASLDSVRKMIQATNLPQEAADARRSLEELSQRLARLEGSGEVSGLKDEIQALDSENQRLSNSVADLDARLEDMAKTQSARAQAAVVQVRASIVAAGKLREALRSSAPFVQPLAEFREAAAGDAGLTAIADDLAPYADSGIPVLATVREEFDAAARRIAQAVRQVEGEGWLAGVANRLSALVSVRRTQFAAEDDSPDAALARADVAVETGDLPAAVAALEKLTGAPRQAADDWIHRAKARIVAEQAMAALHVHAVSAMSPATKVTAMIRTILSIAVLAILAGLAVWLADNPGDVTLQWQGWRIDTSFAVLATVIAAIAFLVAVLYRIWLFLRRMPGKVVEGRRGARRRRGYLALTRGMVAVAAGDADEAQKQVRRADGLLEDPPLTLLLSAQAAQLSGDEKAAEKFFKAMMDRPETEFLGIRGLLTQSLKSDDEQGALALAERASRLRPKSEWVARNLFDLQVRNGAWGDARATLERSVKSRLVGDDEAAHRRVVLDYQLSEETRAAGDGSKADKLLRGALEREPGFVPAALRLARSHIEAGRGGKAASVVEAAWAHAPHPDLAQVYFDARGANDGLERVKKAERLARANPDHRESHLTVAEAALEARLWGEARKHLTAAAGDAPTARICRLMAELEESEHGNAAAAREWLVRASLADPDPAWVCGECGNTVPDWAILCGNCEAFASFAWGTPPHVIRLAGRSGEAPKAIAAGNPATGTDVAPRDDVKSEG